MAFVPGGKYLATTGVWVMSVWDVDTGRVVRTLSTDGTPWKAGFQDWFAFTPDGKRLLSADGLGSKAPGAGEVRKSRLLLWDFPSGKVLMQADLSGVPGALAIRPDGRIAACATHREVVLWDLGSNVIRRVVSGDRYTTIHSLGFARDGKHLVVLPSEGGVCLRINVASGEVLRQVDLGTCDRVALAAGDGTVATYSHPDRLYLYDTSTAAKRALPLKEKVNFLELSFSPDGRTLLAMDRDAEVVQFWDVAKGELLRRLRVPGLGWTSEYAELQLSGDGKTLATNDEHRVGRLWDAYTGQPRLRLPGHVLPPVQLTFSADGKEVVSYAQRGGSLGGQLYRWDVTTGKLLARVSPNAPKEGWNSSPEDWGLAPRGQHLAQRIDRTTYLYEGSTGKRLVLTDKAALDSDGTFTPDGRAVVTIGAGQDVRLWDVTTGMLLRQIELEKKGRPISWVRFTPDGQTLVTGEGWQKVHLWDPATGKHRATLTMPSERKPFQFPGHDWQTAFTPDGRYLFVSNNQSLWVWDLVARREIVPFEEDEHEWTVLTSGQVAVSADGRLMAWFDPALQLRLYELCTGKIVHRFEEDYSSIAFAPSGWRLATGCKADSSVLIWELPLLFRSQPPPGKDTSPEALWAILKAGAVQAHRALWRLAALPEADAFLARHLQPVERVPPERLRALLADLGSPEFTKRESAEKELAAAGEAVRAALAEVSARTKEPEVRRRLAALQAPLQPRAPERLREVRAILALEARGTVEARRLLQRLAAGLSEAGLTQEAKKALERRRR
jgi:WD40 repeat protein